MRRSSLSPAIAVLFVATIAVGAATWSGGRRGRKATAARRRNAVKCHLNDNTRPAAPPTLNADLIQKGYVVDESGNVLSPGKTRYRRYTDRLRARCATDSPLIHPPAQLLVVAEEQELGHLPIRDGLSPEHPRTRSSLKRPRRPDDVDGEPPSRVKIALTSDTEIKKIFAACHEHHLKSTVTGQPCDGELQMVEMKERGTGGQMIGIAECAVCKQRVRAST